MACTREVVQFLCWDTNRVQTFYGVHFPEQAGSMEQGLWMEKEEGAMNKAQKRVLMGFILVVVVMFLFPPFQYGPDNMGYHFIFTDHGWTVNVTMLFAQLVLVLIAGAIAYFAIRGDN